MTERTYKIIMACKQHESGDCVDAVKALLVDQYKNDPAFCGQQPISINMIEAMYDYLDTCDRPSAFLRDLADIYQSEYLSIGERIGRAFMLVRVKRGDQYVNGFGKWAEKNSN